MSGKTPPQAKITTLKSPKSGNALANLETFEGQPLSVRSVTPGKSNSKVVIVSSVANTLSSSGISQVISLAGLRSGPDGSQASKTQPIDLAQKTNPGITIISSNVAGNTAYLNKPSLGQSTNNAPSKFYVTQIRAMTPNKSTSLPPTSSVANNNSKPIAVPISLSRQSTLGTINMTVLSSDNNNSASSVSNVNTTYHVPRGAAAVANLATGKTNIASPALRTNLHVTSSSLLTTCSNIPTVSVSTLGAVQAAVTQSHSSTISINTNSSGNSTHWNKTLGAVQISSSPKNSQFSASYLQIKSPSVTLTAKSPRVVEVSKSLPPKTISSSISNLPQLNNGEKTYLKKLVSPVINLSSDGGCTSKTTVTVTNVSCSTKAAQPSSSLSVTSIPSGGKLPMRSSSFQSVITSCESTDSHSLSMTGSLLPRHNITSITPVAHTICVSTPGPSMPILSAKGSQGTATLSVSSVKTEPQQAATKVIRPFNDSTNYQDMMDMSQALVKLSGQSGSSMTVTPVQSNKFQSAYSGIIPDNDFKSCSLEAVSKTECVSPVLLSGHPSFHSSDAKRNDTEVALRRSSNYLTSLPSPSAGSDCSSGSTTISATSSPGLMLDTDDSMSNIKLECGENEIVIKTEVAPDCDVETITIPASSLSQLSPRKKPRKQLLMSKDMHEDSMDTSEFSNSLLMIDTNAGLKDIEFQRPHMSLLHSVKQPWKTCHNHFVRHSDVKVKEDKKLSVSDIANQKHVLQKASGWKMYHLCSQIENLVELEQQVWDEQSRILKTNEKSVGKETDKELNNINELLKGILQRSQLIQDQLTDAHTQMIKITEHKSNVVDILNKYSTKRIIKLKKL